MPSPTIYSFTLKDSAGVKASAPFYVAYDAATETVGALVGNIAALGALLDAITDAQIIDARIVIDVAPDPSWKSAPAADSNVEKTGLFNFNQDNSKYAQAEDIPAIANAVLDPDQRINLANAAVSAFVSNMTAADGIGGSNTVFANSKFSNALISLRDVVTSFRKHRRALNRRTVE